MAKKKKNGRNSIRFLTVLFSIVIVAYIVRFFWFKIDTEMVKYDTMEDTIPTQGVIIKNEWTTILPAGTKADFKANEGERVSTGKPILKLAKGNVADENIQVKIDKINERIAEIQKSEKDNNFFAQDKQKLDANIDNSLNELQTAAQSGDFSKLETVKEDLAANMYKKSLVSGTESFSGQNLEELLKEKAALEQMLQNSSDIVYARTSGLVSYELDGYEEALKPEGINSLKLSSIQEIIKASAEKDKKKKDEKLEGVKVVDNFEWYIAATVPKGLLSEKSVGKSIKVRFKDLGNAVVTGTVKRFDPGDGQSNLVVIRTTEQVEGFQRVRVVNVDIIANSEEGLIVPLKSIVEREGLKGIYIERSGMAKFVPVKLVLTKDKEAMVENLDKDDKGFSIKNFVLKPYDRVITTVNKVKQDQMLPGAF